METILSIKKMEDSLSPLSGILYIYNLTLGDDGMPRTKKPNRLIHEKSPYLLQHAHNPVNWFPWGPEAFAQAKKEDKPILLSIGYSTCHWCHVMEKESFEDQEVATLLNDAFVAIKVDREERPDLDGIYMSVCQAMTGSGGWPLTVILTPDQKPFFAGTYFPKQNRFGRMGLLELTAKVKELWTTDRREILRMAEKNISVLKAETSISPGEELGLDTLETAFQQLEESYDEQYGGFGYAPKFPTPHNLYFLMRYWKRTGNDKALQMVEKTLTAMRYGGIYDQIGFGFHRYSTDNRWFVPHFEKMLYDQALLALAYLEAYQITGAALYRQTATEIFMYVCTVMTDENGGFYTAEDADSEGVEGKFYLWNQHQLRAALTTDEAKLVRAYFNLEDKGNYPQDSANGNGDNLPYLAAGLAETAQKLGIEPDEATQLFNSARKKLYLLREKRVHPYKDDKILTDWNGLLLAALATGGRVLKETKWTKAAEKAADFFLTRMRTPQGGLWHRYREEQPAIAAFLNDYAFLIWGLLELYETTFNLRYLESALELNILVQRHFTDEENGGFFQVASESREVLLRQKESYDGAIPSGNSVMMLNLIRLARITGDPSLEKEARRITTAFAKVVSSSPANYTQLLCALDFALGPSQEIVIVGRQGEQTTEQMRAVVAEGFNPNKIVLFRPSDEETSTLTKIAPVTNLTALDGQATAYVCRNYRCHIPTTDPNQFRKLLTKEN